MDTPAVSLFDHFHVAKIYLRYDKTQQIVPKWTDKFKEDIERVTRLAIQHRDQSAHDMGTCVLGAGIKIQVFLPRKRYPTSIMLIQAPFQGNTGSYKALRPCLEYINQQFPELKAFWNDGNMD